MKRSGANTRMGIELQSAFLAAGIPAPSLRIHAVIGGGSNAHDAVHLKTDLAQILAPQMVRLGVATAEELATLAGVKVGRLLSISEVIGTTGGVYNNQFTQYATGMNKAAAETPIESGQLRLNLQLQMVFELVD